MLQLFTFLFVLGAFICSIASIIYLSFILNKLSSSLVVLHKRIDSLFSVDPASPNEATKTDTNTVDLQDQNYIPDEKVKLEIEGGDSQVPPEYDK